MAQNTFGPIDTIQTLGVVQRFAADTVVQLPRVALY